MPPLAGTVKGGLHSDATSLGRLSLANHSKVSLFLLTRHLAFLNLILFFVFVLVSFNQLFRYLFPPHPHPHHYAPH